MLTPTPYQREIAAAVAGDVLHERASVFTVEMPLGAGVRELASQLEMLVMSVNVNAGGSLLRVAPTEAALVKDRLVAHLREGALNGLWSSTAENVRLGRARVRYVTHEQLPTVRGSFSLIQVVDAHLLNHAGLERIRLLAAASGATAVFYGRPWSGETPFEQLKVRNKQSQASGGGPLHFRAPLDRVIAELPDYADRAAKARRTLGPEHPEYTTAYELRPVTAGRAFPVEQLHSLFSGRRARRAVTGGEVVASIVLTRLPEPGAALLAPASATAVVTLAERAPDGLRVIDHRWLETVDAASLARAIARFTSKTWACARVTVRPQAGRAAGQVRRLLDSELGARRVIWLDDPPVARSAEVSDLIAAVLTGRLSLYAMDGSHEYRMLRHEVESASLRLGDGRGLDLAMEGPREGFLEGLLVLAHYGAERAQERNGALPAALAS